MSDEEENALAGDARMEWMEGRIANALRCKADAISKMKIDETSMYVAVFPYFGRGLRALLRGPQGERGLGSAGSGCARRADRGFPRRGNIVDFLDDDDAKRLLIFNDAKGALTAAPEPPETYKKNTKVRRPALAAAPSAGGHPACRRNRAPATAASPLIHGRISAAAERRWRARGRRCTSSSRRGARWRWTPSSTRCAPRPPAPRPRRPLCRRWRLGWW